jgi:pimeloyl-ACP methyl ester carboxylesterase
MAETVFRQEKSECRPDGIQFRGGHEPFPTAHPCAWVVTVLTPTERLVETNGVQLRVIEAGDRGVPVVVLAHGFPELAYSWRHQIPVLAEAGYHVIAPDQRGYGGSSKPDAIEDYNVVALCGDVVGLLDDVGAERAVIVGHDWGAVVAWSLPLLHPGRVSGVVGMSVPPIPRPPAPPTHIWRTAFGENFFYILYFQEPGVADADLARDTATTMRRMLGGLRASEGEAAMVRMAKPGPEGFVDRLPEVEALPDWLTKAELDHYIAEFSRTGFTGPLNWYRNFDRNWELTADTPASTIDAPSLFIAGSADPVLSFTPRDRVSDLVKGDYRAVLLDGAGHWLQQERPDHVNRELLTFLSGLEL